MGTLRTVPNALPGYRTWGRGNVPPRNEFGGQWYVIVYQFCIAFPKRAR